MDVLVTEGKADDAQATVRAGVGLAWVCPRLWIAERED